MELNEMVATVQNCTGGLFKEERGVGASREWLDAVKDVTDYVASYIKYNSPGFDGKWYVDVPDHISSKFDIFSKLNIRVTVEDLGEKAKDNSGSGGTDVFRFPETAIRGNGPDKPIYSVPVYVDITAFSDGRELVRNTVANTLIHELNHKWDEYNRAVSSRATTSLFKQAKAYNQLKDGHWFKFIVYRLFSETEQNAAISGLYGDLQGMDSKRENFHEDLKQCQICWLCRNLRKAIDYATNNDNTVFWKNVIEFFKQHPILSPLPLRSKNITPERMKKAFIAKANKELDVMISGIGKVASYYYDMHENSQTSIKISNAGK